MRHRPLLETVNKKVLHNFIHPFTNEPLFDAGKVNCLAINEIVAEKLRAAATRLQIAPRDFYDIDFIIRNGFKFENRDLAKLFQLKLAEDQANIELENYERNIGRSDQEISKMRSRIKEELNDVLTPDERSQFDLDLALNRINNEVGKMITLSHENAG